MSTADKSSITDGIQDVVRNLGDVVRNEVRLAKAEASAGAKALGGGASLIAAGLAFIIPAVTLLGMAGVDLLAEQTALARWIAAGLVSLGLSVVGFTLIQSGRKAMTSNHATLATTADNIKQDFRALKESTQ
jgi:Putative Actinobacterial Holin-X, holin superfamily III